MGLPRVVSSLEGPQAEGAGPALLAELLELWEATLREIVPEATSSMRPGLPESRIRELLNEHGLNAEPELVVWWSWHDGHVPGVATYNRNSQFRLEVALAQFEGQLARGTWDRPWMPVAGESAAKGIAVSCNPAISPPSVRLIDGEFGASTTEASTRHQVISLCTPVTWWIMGFRDGWQVRDPLTGRFRFDLERVPLEWRMTGLI